MASRKTLRDLYDIRMDNVVHLTTLLLPQGDDFKRDRYILGVKTGLLQVVSANVSEFLEKVSANTRTLYTKKGWKTDPLINGELNGRRIGLALFNEEAEELVFGEWME